MSKKKTKKELGINEEFMVFATIRYCVGRRTGISQGMADYIAENYYDKLSDGRLAFVADDIRSCIYDNLHISYDFTYDGTVSRDKRLPLEDFMEFLSSLDNVEEDLCSISNIKVYCESYKDTAPKLFDVTKHERNVGKYICQYDITCLLSWQRLAALFDKRRYKKVRLNKDGEEYEAIVIETYVEDSFEIEDKPGWYRPIPWKYKKVYMNVESLKSGDVSNGGYYTSDYVVSVEDYNAFDVKE